MTAAAFPWTVALAAVIAAPLTLPTDVDAQPRYARRAVRSVVVLGAYYQPLFCDPWYHPYGWYPPFGYGTAFPADSSIRLQVSPRETEVFVDGYYAGTVDDFDGFFQRLHLEPGEHEITLYLPGYRTTHQQIYLQPTGTFRIRHTMEALPPGAPAEPRPAAPVRPRAIPPPGPPPRPAPDARASPRSAGAGTLAIRVQPADADVIIDGERWDGPALDEQLVLEVVAGPHRLEIRREGYRTYTSEVTVRDGETERLNVSLSRE